MTVSDWSSTAGSNVLSTGIAGTGGVNIDEGMAPSGVNNAMRSIMAQLADYTRRGSDLASASTLNLDSVDALLLNVTGTTTVTAVTLTSGHWRIVRATGAFQITASASLIVNGQTATNYTTSAGDYLLFEGYGSSVVRVSVLATIGAPYVVGGTDVALADGGTGASLADPNADRIMFWDDSAGAVTWLTASTGLAITTTNLTMSFLGLETLTDPNADRLLFWDDSAGSFAWLTLPTGLTFSGTAIALANDLAALEAMSGTGLVARTASETYAQRTIVGPAFGITVTNGDGVSGNPTLALSDDLAALEGLSNGIPARTSSNTWASRTITGTSAEITVTNGDGISGNPTLSLPTALTFTGKTITGGTFASVTLNGTPTISGTPTAAGATWSNLGAVTTVDINGGTIDGAVIGGSSAAAGTFTTLTSTSTASFVNTLTLTSTDAGASPGPILQLFRSSATPAASDLIGLLGYYGKDSGGNDTLYSFISSEIADPTNGSEDATLHFQTMVAGTSTERLTLNAAGATVTGTLTASGGGSLTGTWSNLGTVTTIDINGGTIDGATIGGSSPAGGTFTGLTVVSTDAGAGDGPNLVIDRNSASPAAADVLGAIYFRGRDSGGNTADYGYVYGTIDDPTNGSEDGVISIQTLLAGVATGAIHVRGGVTRFYQDTTSTPGSGNNTTGAALTSNSTLYLSSATAPLNCNITADGNVVGISSGGTSQGVISVSGTTVTYGSFFGSHWSQLADGSKPDIPRGTIVESVDQMAAWPGEVNEHLPCFKISDRAGSKAVYGVFAWWDSDEGPTNDAFVGSLGAYFVRIAKGEKVARGDLIESNGDGCGRVQANDLMRSSTVAKVTSTEVVDQYPDGSYTVPCTLHCG